MADERGTILIVDDDVLVLAALSKIVRRAGYNTMGATSGKEALKIYRQLNSRIDMVLVDYFLPDLNGLGLAEQISKEHPGSKVLGMSGMFSVEERFRALGLEFIQKPFDEQELLNKISEYAAL